MSFLRVADHVEWRILKHVWNCCAWNICPIPVHVVGNTHVWCVECRWNANAVDPNRSFKPNSEAEECASVISMIESLGVATSALMLYFSPWFVCMLLVTVRVHVIETRGVFDGCACMCGCR